MHQSLRYSPEDALEPWLPTECPAKTLIRLCGCAAWSGSSLGAHEILQETLCPCSNVNWIASQRNIEMQLIAVYMLVYMGVDKGKQAVMSKGRNQMQNALARDKSPSFWCTGKAVLCDCVSVLPFGASGRQCFVILSLSFLLVPREGSASWLWHILFFLLVPREGNASWLCHFLSFLVPWETLLHDHGISCLSFGASGRLCDVILTFTGHLHLYFMTYS